MATDKASRSPLAKTEKMEDIMRHILGNFTALKYMNELVKLMNNELAYLDEWIWLVPDEATDDDLLSIAEDEENYKEAEKLFFDICKKYGKDGLYIGK